MARLLYACRFEVPAASGLDQVVAAYRDWLVGHYKDRRGDVNFSFDPSQSGEATDLPNKHSLRSAVYEAEPGRAVCISWSFPDEIDEGLSWSNEVRIGQFADRCSVEHLIYIESVEYSVSPARLSFGSPRVVRDICTKAPVYVGDMQIQATPYILRQDRLADLIALLTSELRRLPVVLLSPSARGDANLIDGAELARNLAGVAVVVNVEDPEVTWGRRGREATIMLQRGRQNLLAGIFEGPDPRRHRLFFGAWIEEAGSITASRTIERAIARP